MENNSLFPLQLFRSKLLDTQKLKKELQPFIIEIDKQNIEWIFGIISQLSNIITSKESAIVLKFNAFCAIRIFMDTCHIAVINLIQIYLLNSIYEVALYKCSENTADRGLKYFIDQGYAPTTPDIEKYGYNHVKLATELLTVAKTIKPKRLFQSQQTNSLSLFSVFYQRLLKKGFSPIQATDFYKADAPAKLRTLFETKLNLFTNDSQNYTKYFCLRCKQSLRQGFKPGNSLMDIRRVFASGDLYVTTPVLELCMEDLKKNKKFLEKRNILILLNDFVSWGDVQAYVKLIQYQSLDQICKKIIQAQTLTVQKCKALYPSAKDEQIQFRRKLIYPEINDQKEEKYLFYIEYLKCIERWAACYPIQALTGKGNSKLKKIYNLLHQKGIKFPQQKQIDQFKQNFHQSFKNNKQRNQMLRKDYQPEDQKISLKEQQIKKQVSKKELVSNTNKEVSKSSIPSAHIIKQIDSVPKNTKDQEISKSTLPAANKNKQIEKEKAIVDLHSQTIRNQIPHPVNKLSKYDNFKMKVSNAKKQIERLYQNQSQIDKKMKNLEIFRQQFQKQLQDESQDQGQDKWEQLLDQGLIVSEKLDSIFKIYKKYKEGKVPFSQIQLASKVQSQIFIPDSEQQRNYQPDKSKNPSNNQFKIISESKIKPAQQQIIKESQSKHHNQSVNALQINKASNSKQSPNNSFDYKQKPILLAEKNEIKEYRQKNEIKLQNSHKNIDEKNKPKLISENIKPESNKIITNQQDSRKKNQESHFRLNPKLDSNSNNINNQKRQQFQVSHNSSIIQQLSISREKDNSQVRNFDKKNNFQEQYRLDDEIEQPQINPLDESYHDIKQLEDNIKKNPHPTFKSCFSNDKYLINNSNKKHQIFWLGNDTMNLVKPGKRNPSNPTSRVHVPELLHERNLQFQNQLKYIQKQKEKQVKILENKIKLLENTSKNMKEKIQNQQKELKLMKEVSQNSQIQSNKVDYMKDQEHLLRNKMHAENHLFTPVKTRAMSQNANGYAPIQPKGKLVSLKNYSSFFKQFLDEKSKKSILKQKDLLFKDDIIEIGYMHHRDHHQLVILLYITPTKQISSVQYSLNTHSNLSIKSYPKLIQVIKAKKQQKITLDISVIDPEYTLPELTLLYHLNGEDKSIKMIIPCSFHKFVQLSKVEDRQMEQMMITPTYRGEQIPYSRKIIKEVGQICEYLPHISVLRNGKLNEQGQVTYGGRVSYLSTSFYLKISVKQNQFLYVQALAEKGDTKIVQYYLCLITQLFMKQIDWN